MLSANQNVYVKNPPFFASNKCIEFLDTYQNNRKCEVCKELEYWKYVSIVYAPLILLIEIPFEFLPRLQLIEEF